jgi:4-diphosphocytidyl-2-C-methyl-D-erythritol kinase
MSRVRRWSLQSPAKLNWSLRVLGKRADGFHQLHSLFVAADLYDRLTLNLDAPQSPRLEVEGLGAEQIPQDERNLVLRAEAAWRQAGGEAPAVSWHLHKRIPAAAGLGGGSGNAAAALRLLQHVATQAPHQPLVEIAAELGSDIPFFLGHGPVFLGGRGETILGTIPLFPQRVILVAPPIEVATPAVFQALAAPEYQEQSAPNLPLPSQWSSEAGPNDLLPAVLKASPDFAQFWQELQQIAPFHLSGSGGACFLPQVSPQESARLLPQCQDLCDYVWKLSCLTGPVLGVVHEHPES